MHEYAEIVGYRENEDNTKLAVIIPKKDIGEYLKRFAMNGKVPAEIRIDDGRSISADQRKKIYATIKDISLYTGYMPEETKEIMKYYYIAETGGDYFSLSSCSMTTARLFINYLIEFCFEWDIPLLDHGLDRTDDIGKYLWLCLKYKRCAICGKEADLHHVDAIGIGRDRTKVDDSNHEKTSLCRVHHTEAHTIGWTDFSQKYHVYGIIFND
ncbi:Putative HNHc nuclease [Geosporobacter subterraneus DSM 17957]|uniref:Putative HNHc nuclease n=1 Tax=Geosporobacter subterraneus DSM 17957 TaxID=1121919 RepID=A0A1M6DRB4_9FIRM|nr:putative HNHc nuclease [Geosporobacter subterraneus]SHI75669.1 Putative HNHc nuclease [Geosporobacter subterraneus DSM 17957]